MWIAGVMLGLGAATSQSVSYIFSRLFVIRRHQGVMRLLVLSHVLMGIVSAAMLPWFWPDRMPPLARTVWPLVRMAGFYLLGQAALFFALRRVDASRASPLLALKVVILAVLAATWGGQDLAAGQWVAVGLCVLGAMVLNYSGGAIPWPAAASLVLACGLYSLSDISIKILVDELAYLGRLQAVMLSVCLCYLVCGTVATAMLPLAGRGSLKDLGYAAPFSAAWLTGMVCLYGSFAHVGVVYGNILQSMRGLVSILIGAMLVRWELFHLERKTTRWVLARRVAAAAMMSAAVALYEPRISQAVGAWARGLAGGG